VLVVEDFAEAGSGFGQSGDVVHYLLHSGDLFIQEWVQELRHMTVALFSSQFLEFDDGLIDLFLQLQSCFHGLEPGSPLILLRLLDIFEHDASAAVILKLHELLSVLTFFLGGLLEEFVESTHADIIPTKVESHGGVDVVGIQLHVDLLVDAGFAFLRVVLAESSWGHL